MIPITVVNKNGVWISEYRYMSAVDMFVKSGLCKTKSEAKRLITQGGAYVNDIKVKNINTEIRHYK